MQADERPAGEPTGGDAGPSSSAYDALGPAQLLEAVEKIHKGFNPASMTLDTYLELALKQHRVLNEDSRSFIQQVVYGIIRYEKFLVSILKSFFYFRR